LLEKVPLLAVVAASSWMTLRAQGEALVSNEVLPLEQRLGYSLVSYVVYLGRLVYPVDLAVLYPRPDPAAPVLSNAAAALVLLAGVTAIAVIWRRKCPYFLVGWLWYLGMLFPVSGVFGFGYGRSGRLTASRTCRRSDWELPWSGSGRSLPRLAAVALGVLRRVGDRARGPHVGRLVSDFVLAR